MAIRFGSEIALVDRELSRVRADIVHADSIALSTLASARERAAAHRAAAYVWLASVLERTVRTSLQTTVREISALAIPSKSLRVSLFTLICDGDFTSIGARNRQATWDTKLKMLSRLLDDSPAVLSDDILPLDGRTIRAEHFDTIWLVFGLSGTSLPSAHHRIAPKDLADGRNEVAHGHRDPVAFGRTKATADILKLTGRVDDVIANLLVELDAYILTRRFSR